MKSRLGLGLAGIYLLSVIYFAATQGVFGESFIMLILGLPWTLGLAAIEFGGVAGSFAYVLIFAPIVLNAAILYWIGSRITRLRS